MKDDVNPERTSSNEANLRRILTPRLLVLALLAILGAVGALWFGESAELERVRGLAEGAGSVSEIGIEAVRPELEGTLVHVRGMLQPSDALHDDSLGIAAPALRLHRSVEMFQWQERVEEVAQAGTNDKKKVKTYGKTWSTELIPSRGFEAGHENPSALKFVERYAVADRAQLGAFLLGQEAILQLSNFQPLTPTQEMIDHAPADVRGSLRITGQALYLGRDPAQPEIGDTRITLQVVPPQPVSVLGAQHGSELNAYRTKAGGTVFVIQPGDADVAALFVAADVGTSSWTWASRGIAWLFLGTAITMVLSAFGAGGRAAPRFGRFVFPGLALFGVSAAAVFGGVAVGAVWVQQKPAVGAVAFGVGVLGLIGSTLLVLRARKQRRA